MQIGQGFPKPLRDISLMRFPRLLASNLRHPPIYFFGMASIFCLIGQSRGKEIGNWMVWLAAFTTASANASAPFRPSPMIADHRIKRPPSSTATLRQVPTLPVYP
jgi:hypothetical protein